MAHLCLTLDEVCSLPEMRPRWVAHLGALIGLSGGLAIVVAQRRFLEAMDSTAPSWDLPVAWGIALLVISLAGPWALVAWVFRSLGFDWTHVVIASVVPYVGGLILTWRVGFRLVRRPYRDWRPSRTQRGQVRPFPGGTFHALEQDLERFASPQDLILIRAGQGSDPTG